MPTSVVTLKFWPILGALSFPGGSHAEDPPTAAYIEEFLRTADVVAARPVGKGVTETWRLTLQDGAFTHDASFQSVDERAPLKVLGGGRTEVDFVDSYRYNIAAYRLARLLGLEAMVPVSVARKWRTETGAFTWWVDDVLMDEEEMKEKGLKAPDESSFSEQIYTVRLFSQLIHDTDRNRGNLLITTEWRIWMIDFTRAFRRWPKLQSPEGLERCDRALLETLRRVTPKDLETELNDTLSRAEIEGIAARRDLLVQHYERLVRERGENAVLYPSRR
jgi:hypothetical protein